MGATLPTVALPDIMLIAPAPDRGPGKANAHRRDGADRIFDRFICTRYNDLVTERRDGSDQHKR
jgi:hypothetical protein